MKTNTEKHKRNMNGLQAKIKNIKEKNKELEKFPKMLGLDQYLIGLNKKIAEINLEEAD